MAGAERQDAGTFAYTLVEHLADEHGDDDAQAYLIEVVEEVMLLDPGVKEHVVDAVLADLKEDIARREDSRYSHAIVQLIAQIQTDWSNDS